MEDRILQLIYRNLVCSIGRIEKKELDDWLQSEDNNRVYHAIATAWNASGKSSVPIDIDLDTEFVSLSNKIGGDDMTKGSLRVKWITPLAIAAGLSLLIGFIFLTQEQRQSNEVAWIEVESGEETKLIELQDNSIVHLNRHSALRYPNTFVESRNLTLVSGEAYFEVVHDKSRPFIVETKNAEIKVLGTSFSVKNDELNVAVVVSTGKVSFKSKASIEEIILVANENALLKDGILQKDVLSTNEIGWHTGIFNFERAPLGEIIVALENYHHGEIKLQQPSLLNCIVSVSFNKNSLLSSLETLSIILSAQVTQLSDNSFVMVGGRCQ